MTPCCFSILNTLWCLSVSRWIVTFLWSFGGCAVSETSLWTATSDKEDLAGLPARSPSLPAQVCCRMELQLLHFYFFALFFFSKARFIQRKYSLQLSANNWLPHQPLLSFTWPAANIVLLFLSFFLFFLSISFSFSDLSADKVWWPLSNPQ